MNFNLDESIELLGRTPAVITVLLENLSQPWLMNNEGSETWSPYDVVGHPIHADKTNWLPRAKGILDHGENYTFEAFDRFAMLATSKGKTMKDLLEEFAAVRDQNILTLRSFNLTENDLEKTGKHPEFGSVTLRQLLSTWVVHDLDHLGQIARTMAKQYKTEVGPWQAYLSILKSR